MDATSTDAVLAFPPISKIAIACALMLVTLNTFLLITSQEIHFFTIPLALAISGYVADAMTGILHFCFDYVFPHKMPLLGPAAKEFQQHHEMPTLDPSSAWENLTKGAFASIPGSVLFLATWPFLELDFVGGLTATSLLMLSLWGFFFHQIHSYAHMGGKHDPQEFLQFMDELGKLPDDEERRKKLAQKFATVEIPPVVRFLQNCRFLLSPERHNLHHLHFEADFSSVNGWSDPLLNIVLTPLARRLKQARGD